MNPFWPPAGAPALQYGAKASNMNVVPSTDLHAVRGGSSVEKGQGLAIFPGPAGKDKNSQAANSVDAAQRKQILLQQALPPGAHSNILHGPTFIFPMNQQQAAAAAAASVRPGSVKSSPAAGSVASSSSSSSASISATASAVAGATAMSFNYPNFPGNETQYLAILQNGAYPIPIPAHVGPTTAYRGTHPQAMPLFNGSFYSSRMVHPSQLQQQQQPSTQTQQSQQGHQNPSISSGSSSSQKHLQNQQHKPHGSAGSGNLQGFPCPKNQPPQSLPNHQRQLMQNQNVTHQARQLESELGGEDSPSTADSRVSRANMSIYGQNLMPIHPANFALMNPPPMGSAHSASGNTGEKKSQQPQTQASKAGVEPLASQTFAMSFAPINGTTASPGLDISSLAQNHALLQSLPEAARHGYHHFIAAAQATQQKNYRVSEEGKSGGNDTSNVEEERKAVTGGKTPLSAGQSIVFSRPDLTDSPVSTMPVNNVVDSSARNLNLGSAPARTSGSFMSATIGTVNAPSMQQQMQRNHHHQQQQWNQQIFQFQKQQQFAAAAAASTRSKTPATSNGSVYSDHISSSSSAATKFPNALSAFPQNLVQSSSSPAQSPQWKSSARTTTSQVPSSSLTSSSSTLKNLPQQQGRTQQSNSHISFAANQKSSASPQGQPNPSSNQSSSPPLVVGSPTTSISKSAGGSPRTSTSTSNKGGQSSQQSKNSASVPVQKSSPVGGRNIPSILGYPHNSSSSNPGAKPQLSHQQQQQQQHLTKHALQAQLIYTNAFMQAQAQHVANSTNVSSAASGFYLQRHRSEQQPQPHGAAATSSTGMLFRVEEIKEQLLENNKQTYWVPDYVKEKRFHNWLENARDWAVSRSRFWGTPLPVWMSDDGEEVIVMDSIAKLEKLSGVKVFDLHRHNIDHITIPSSRGPEFGVLRRVEDVFDCWFESGSMPYAYIHYPFENVELFEKNFPGHFVAEGLDQTRGWFYTLMVLSTALFGKPAFRNLICNGLVLAEDGKKMSKSLKNYPSPMEVINDYGADALRLYLINSPVVRAETLRFKKEGVFSVVKDVFLPWYNAYRFLVQNAKRLEVEGLAPFTPIDAATLQGSSNVLDQWINSATQSLVHFVHQEMNAYRLYTVVPYLLKFLDNLTNIYVRFNRKRLKGRTGEEDCRTALSTLYNVLLISCKVMAPFTPFFSEGLYQNMRRVCTGSEESIHYCSFPQVEGERNERIEQSVARMMTIIDLARNIRERHNKPLKSPLREMIVVHPDVDFLDDIAGKLKEYVLEELNVRSLIPCNDTLKYASLRAEPEFSVLGKRLGKSMGVVAKEVKAMSQIDILEFEKAGEVTIASHCLKLSDIKVVREFKCPDGLTDREVDAAGDGDVLVILDLRLDESLYEAGVAREVVNRIQKLRKKTGLEPTDAVEVYFESLDEDKSISQQVLNSQELYIRDAIGSPLLSSTFMPPHAVVLGEESFHDISKLSFTIYLARPALVFKSDAILSLYGGNTKSVHGLETYLLSRDHSNLKSEFQLGDGKITVDAIEGLPAVNMVLGEHVFLTVGDSVLSTKGGR